MKYEIDNKHSLVVNFLQFRPWFIRVFDKFTHLKWLFWLLGYEISKLAISYN